MLAKTLNKSEVVLRNRALDPRGLESPGPIFKTLILSLVSLPQTVRLTTFDPYLLCWPQQPINVHSTQSFSVNAGEEIKVHAEKMGQLLPLMVEDISFSFPQNDINSNLRKR